MLLNILPFAGAVLATYEGGPYRFQNNIRKGGLGADEWAKALDNPNATAPATVSLIDYQSSQGGTAITWEAELTISVAGYVPLPKSDLSDDSNVQHATGFKLTAGNKDTIDSHGDANICVILLTGMSGEILANAQNYTNNSCDMIPEECLKAISDELSDSIDERGCNSRFNMPPTCKDTFPEGSVESFNLNTTAMRDDGYFFSYLSPFHDAGSDRAAKAYAETLTYIWPIWMATSRDMIGDVSGSWTIKSRSCLRAHRFEEGSEDPNKKQENNEGGNEDNEDPPSAAGHMSYIGLSGLLGVVGLVIALV